MINHEGKYWLRPRLQFSIHSRTSCGMAARSRVQSPKSSTQLVVMGNISYPVKPSGEHDTFSWPRSWQTDFKPINLEDLEENEYEEPQPCSGFSTKLSSNQESECLSCSFVTDDLHPHAAIHSFVMQFCVRRGYEAFYILCDAFDISKDDRVKIQTSNSSLQLQCFDVLHRAYHRRDEQLSLAMIKSVVQAYEE